MSFWAVRDIRVKEFQFLIWIINTMCDSEGDIFKVLYKGGSFVVFLLSNVLVLWHKSCDKCSYTDQWEMEHINMCNSVSIIGDEMFMT